MPSIRIADDKPVDGFGRRPMEEQLLSSMDIKSLLLVFLILPSASASEHETEESSQLKIS